MIKMCEIYLYELKFNKLQIKTKQNIPQTIPLIQKNYGKTPALYTLV